MHQIRLYLTALGELYSAPQDSLAVFNLRKGSTSKGEERKWRGKEKGKGSRSSSPTSSILLWPPPTFKNLAPLLMTTNVNTWLHHFVYYIRAVDLITHRHLRQWNVHRWSWYNEAIIYDALCTLIERCK